MRVTRNIVRSTTNPCLASANQIVADLRAIEQILINDSHDPRVGPVIVDHLYQIRRLAGAINRSANQLIRSCEERGIEVGVDIDDS